MFSVSIVTVSQFYRVDFLKILAKCIKNQLYKNIKEWVIVDTSFVGLYKTENDLTDIIEEFKLDKTLPNIVYYKSNKNSIGGWRNETSMLVSGDIIVCMDDDDYYPPSRISHAVEMLSDKKVLLAGCDKLHFYDIHYDEYYQFNGFGSNHTTNNCMAYWREYLNDHSYDETVSHAEETSFTNNFTVPIIQLESEKTVLQFSHNINTYDKKNIIYTNHLFEPGNKYITQLNKKINDFIVDKEIHDDYQVIFDVLKQPKKCEYDIVYYLGLSPLWSPLQNNLGGSEQAVKYLSMCWAKKGLKIAVYGNLSHTGNIEGVEYIDYKNFKFWYEYNILILWRLHGCYPFINYNLKTRKLFVDIHDNIPQQYDLLFNHNKKINAWMLKSEFHRDFIENLTGKKLVNNIVIPNGLRIENFNKNILESRNSFRMCYCSCYTRGLQRILKNIWPIIYELEPKAELHVYYGMDLVEDNEFKNEMRLLLSQPGVMDHGKQSLEVINREKHMSTFHLYYTDCLGEIDCISIRESLIAGCIPIISDTNIFKFRDGIHLKWLPNVPDFNQQIAYTIIELLHNKNLQQTISQELHKSPTIISWQQSADEWFKYFN
ncbi:putative glycosyltransferase [Cotonvirus japonicus]|uniref:Glycosyltransferase n=1 Tax=Cotonvirus japonicus TaxID=2811091 RepID=A0ABM7NRY9_9VIRU|nr:putative glycosyltransferase [Cotonvirus japonicus]BCS82928.1 putative glycosyltransferase [Cotonvirus japonicus]